MKKLALVFFICFTLQASAETPANEIPLYAGVEKTKEMIQADKKFINETIKIAGNRTIATDQVINAGWAALYSKDEKKAIRRFNQAYLLSPEDYRVYWGLGNALGMAGKYDEAEKMLLAGAKYNADDFRFLCDVGFGIQLAALSNAKDKKTDSSKRFIEAKKYFEKAQKLNPDSSLPHSKLAINYFYQGDIASAKKEVAESQKLGAEGLDPLFVADLNKL